MNLTDQEYFTVHVRSHVYHMMGSIQSFLCSVTFLAFDDPENSFSLHTTATESGIIIGALTAKSLMEIEPSLIPVRGSSCKLFCGFT
jgi:hypothetical protein